MSNPVLAPSAPSRIFLGLKNQSPTEVVLSKIFVVAQFAMVWFFVVEGLKPIIGDWHIAVRLLAAFSIVAATFRYKYNLYGQSTFPTRYALAVMLIVSPVIFFDALGLYWSTGYSEQVERDRTTLLSGVQGFYEHASTENGRARAEIEAQYTEEMRQADNAFAEEKMRSDDRLTSAETSPAANELTISRAKKNEKTDQERAEADRTTRKAAAQSVRDGAMRHLEEVDKLLAGLVDVEAGHDGDIIPVAIEIAEAENFGEMRDAARHAGSVMGKVRTAFAATGIAPEKEISSPDLTVSEGNIFEIFVTALFKGDVTAFICFLVAVLFELDILVIWLIRRDDEEAKPAPAASVP